MHTSSNPLEKLLVSGIDEFLVVEPPRRLGEIPCGCWSPMV